MGIDLGVLEGQISRDLFSDSIFYPSVIGASVHPTHLPGPDVPALRAEVLHTGQGQLPGVGGGGGGGGADGGGGGDGC